jgi:aromatic-L-amino-acid decarboxylase
VTAREAHGLKAKDLDRAVVYLSEQTHHAIDKALRIAGLKDSLKRFVPLDGRHRMRPEALQAAVEDDAKAGLRPWLIAATAGTTDTGPSIPSPTWPTSPTVTGSGCTWMGLMGHLSP